MKYTVEDRDEAMTISFTGQIVLDKIVRVEREIIDRATASDRDLIINLEKVDYLDSTGIGLFLKLSGIQKKKGRSFRVINITSRVAKILELSSLEEFR